MRTKTEFLELCRAVCSFKPQLLCAKTIESRYFDWTELTTTMTDNWDDSDDDWDVDDDALDAKLGLAKEPETSNFDDEEDLALTEKAAADKAAKETLKKKGSALAAKKKQEEERKLELEIARKELEYQAEIESKMSPDELRALERQRVEEADNALTDDLFGAVDKMTVSGKQAAAQQAGDKVVMKDMKDHMKHARKVAECLKVSRAFCTLSIGICSVTHKMLVFL